MEIKSQDMITEDKLLPNDKFLQSKHTNNKLVMGRSRCHDFKRVCLQNDVCLAE